MRTDLFDCETMLTEGMKTDNTMLLVNLGK